MAHAHMTPLLACALALSAAGAQPPPQRQPQPAEPYLLGYRTIDSPSGKGPIERHAPIPEGESAEERLAWRRLVREAEDAAGRQQYYVAIERYQMILDNGWG